MFEKTHCISCNRFGGRPGANRVRPRLRSKASARWIRSIGQVVFTCLKKVNGTNLKTIQQMYEAGYRIVSATQTIKSESTMDTYTTLFLERSVGTGK